MGSHIEYIRHSLVLLHHTCDVFVDSPDTLVANDVSVVYQSALRRERKGFYDFDLWFEIASDGDGSFWHMHDKEDRRSGMNSP